MAIQVKISQPVKNIRAFKIALKINSKGLLAAYSSQFLVGDEVILLFNAQLRLNAKIHKLSTNSKGQKGMIIKYSEMSEEQAQQLQALLNVESYQEKKKEKSIPETDTQAMMPEKTIITSLNTLDHLALQSPDQQVAFVAATMDEESQRSPSLNSDINKTKVEAYIPQMETLRNKRFSKKIRTWVLGAVALSLLTFAVVKKLSSEEALDAEKIQAKIVSVQKVKKKPKIVKRRSQRKKRRTRSVQKKKPSSVSVRSSQGSTEKTSLTELTYSKSPAFYKLSLSANKPLPQARVQKLSGRLRFDFKNVLKSRVKSKFTINDKIIKSILTSQVSGTTRIEINLRQKSFPRYDVKVYDRFVDIIIFTQ